MNKAKKIIVLIIIAALFLLGLIPINRYESVKAINGTADFSSYQFAEKGLSYIGGQWELYFNKFLTPDEIKNMKPSCYYNIPGKLADQINGQNKGFMTLHVKVKVPEDGVYGILLNSIFTSSEIYINGIKIDGHGTVGKNKYQERPTFKPITACFPSKNREVDIMIHASVYQDIEPVMRSALFGTRSEILKNNYKNTFADSFVIGILFIAALLNLGCYFTKTKQNAYLMFSSICILLLLRAGIFNTRIFCQVFDYIPYELISRIAAITFYLLVQCYVLFIDDIFDKTMIIRKPAILYGSIFSIICLVTKSTFYDRMGYLTQGIMFIFVIYMIVFLIKKVKEKNKNVSMVIFPLVILFVSAINDIIVNNSALGSNYLSSFGALFFVVSQSLYIIKNYMKSYEKLQRLNRDSLTSLYTNKYIKHLISKQLDIYKSHSSKFSLIMIDIDNFKSVNDSFGHMFGDTVIKDVADLLREVAEENCYVGRFGGDEFVIIVPGRGREYAECIADNIMSAVTTLNENYTINRQISLSVGVYENKCDSVEKCMKCVDTAMYSAKKSGKGCVISC